MLIRLAIGLAGLGMAVPAHAQSDLEKGFDGALRGCEEWVLLPQSWLNGTDPFVAAVGLGPQMASVPSVDDASLPPPALRVANHYWRINATTNAGYILVVSDQLPMCHITGGGGIDLQPVVEAVLHSSAFERRWERIGETTQGDMLSTTYRNREYHAFTMIVSRAKEPGQRLDRVQLLASAIFDISR